MSNTPTKVLFKRSDVANKAPDANKLVPGEIALNTADGKIYLKNDAGVVIDTGKQIFQRNTNVTVTDDGINPGYVVTSVDGQTKFTVDPSSATLDADLVMVGGRVISLRELATNGTNKVNLAAPDNLPLDYTLRFPETQGTAGQVMAIGENGQLGFVAPDRFGGNRVYVSADRGDDANDGINAPVATVKRAAQIASELIFEPTGTPATGAHNTRVLLFKNKEFIKAEVAAYITANYPAFTYGALGTTAGAAKSKRDSGLILDGAIFDMYFGGNEKSREYGLSFYNGTATYLLANEKAICVQALTYAKTIAQSITTNTLVASPYQTAVTQVRDSVNYGTSSNATTIGNKYDIAIGILNNGTGSAPTLDPGAYRIRGVSIRIAPGNYFENNPIIVPDAVSIIGDDLRSAVVRPLNANKDIFRVRNGVYMNGFTFRDHVTTAGVPDYTWRYTHAFDDVYDTEINRADWTWIGNSMPLIVQSPYVQNCSIVSFLGGSGMLIDGSKVQSPNIPKYQIEAENPAVGDVPEQGKSMVGNAYTMLSFGGTGWQVINNAYSQIVGCFQIFLLNGIYAQSGGYISVTNSATNFGTFALRSSGYSDKSFTFDRGIIAANGSVGGAQTLTIIGTQRVPLVQYVLRVFNPSNGADITNSYKSSPTVVPFNAATALTLGSSVFTISGHGFFTGNSVYYSRNGNLEINGLSDNGIYYVQVANLNQFVLYNDDSFKYPVKINSPGTGTQQLIKNPEEFYVNDISTSHSTYQTLVLAGTSYTFVPGRAISATVDIYQANAYVYSWDSGSGTLIISNETTNVNGSDERILFTATSTINQDHALSPATAIVINSVAVKTGLTTAVVFPRSTIEGGIISSIGGLPEKRIAFHRPSIVNSSAHTWEYAGSGTDYNALPQNGGVPNPAYEQYSEAPGRVYVSGTNELGDFKVGNFITAENRSGLITFKSKVTVGELNVLKLTLSTVQINQISADVGLGDNEPGGASNQRLPTQKAVRSFLANRLGSVIDKGVSTNSVPGSLVQLNASGQINADLLPPQKAAITYQVGTWNGRLSLYNKIPPVDIGISDQANEKYYQQTLTLSNTVSATIGQVVTQTNRNGKGIVKYVVTSSNQVTIANSTGTFSTNSIDHIKFDGVDSGYYPTDTGTAVQQSETYYLALDNKSQFLLIDSGSHSFTVGATVTAAKNLATGAVTEYRQGVLYNVNNTGINGGTGYQPGSGSVIYYGVPLTSVSGSGTGAIADITVTSGAVTNVAVNFGGSGYAVGDTLSANVSYLGGTSTVTFTITVSRADNRLYVNLNGNNVKFLATSGSPDYIEDDNASTNSHTFTAFGNAQLSTAQKKYGSASLALDGTGDYISTGSSTDFKFDAAAWTIETWIYNTSNPGTNQILFDFRTASPQTVLTVYLTATTNTPVVVYNGGNILTTGDAIPLNTWTHFAIAKTGTSTKMFINGAQTGGTYTDNNSYSQGPLTIGARFDGTLGFNGYLDDVRISKGIARYTTTFTAPTAQLTRQDAYTVLLLNFNGPNGTTNINYSDYVKTIADLTYYSNKTFNAASIGGGGNVDYSLSRITINGHGFSNGDPVYYSSGVNTAIGNLVSSSSYFAKAIDSNTIELYTNYNLSTKINFGLTSTGTHNISRYNVNIDNFFLLVPAHGYTTGTPVRITGSTPPGGLTDNEYVYIGSVTTNAFTLHATQVAALTSISGISTAPLGLTSTGAGSLTFITQNVQINGTLNTSSRDAANWNNLTSTTIDASGIVSGVINPSRLGGTGTANNQTFLRGDSSWAYATASAKPATDSPITISGNFDIRAGVNYYHGDLTFDVNHIDPTLGATYTNFGVVSLNKSQFTITSTGQTSITGGVIDAATLGGFGGSYYLTPSNFIAQVPITKGGTNLTTYSKGDILYAPGTNSLSQLNIGSTGQVLNVDATGIPAWTDSLSLPGSITVQSTTQSTLTSNGSIVTAGGVGIAKNLYVGQAANIAGDITGTGALTVNSANKNISLQPTGTGTVTINPATKGAIDNVDIGSTTRGSGKFTTLAANGNTTVTSNTTSTSTSTGALVVSGGVGIGENLNVYGNAIVGGNLTVNGTTTTVNSTTVTIEDPIIVVGGGAGGAAPTSPDGLDRGIAYQYYNGSAKIGFFGLKTSDGYFEFIPDATLTGNTVTGALGDIKAATFRGSLVSSNVTITGGSIDNATIGSTNANTGAFTTLTASGATTLTAGTASTDATTGTLVVTGGVGVSGKINSGSVGTGALTATGAVSLNGANITVSLQPTGTGTVTIKPNTTGVLDNVTIGATTARAGTFTDLTANTSVSMSPSGTVTINPTTAGTINNMSIGATIRGSGAFTTLAANGAVTFTQNTASTTTTSGTLVVTGGVGISGAINIGSTIAAGGATFSSVTDSGLTSGRVTFAGTSGILSDSTNLTYNTSTNTLTTVNVSATAVTAGTITDTGLTSGRVVIASTGGQLADSSTLTFSAGTLTVGTSIVAGGVTVGSADITLTGGNVTGAVGITATGTVQGAHLKDTSLTTGRVTFATTGGQLADSSTLTFNSGTSTLTTTNLTVTGVATASLTNSGLTSGRVTFATTGGLLTDSSSLTFNGTTLTANALTISNATQLNGTLGVTGVTSVTNTTQSTSTSDGALVVSGGVGIAKNANVGGNLVVTGNLTVNGTTTTVNSTTTTIEDPILNIGGGIGGAAPSAPDSKDRGIQFQYYDTAARNGFFGFDAATGYFKFIPVATIAGEVASGTLGDLQAGNFRGNVLGGTGSFTTLTASSATTFTSSTDSSSLITGAVQISGGAAVTKRLNVGGAAAFGLNSFNYGTISGSATGYPINIGSLGSDTDVSINITPQGAGIVSINSNKALQIPVGASTDRPSNPVNGLVRFNTTSTQFEGYNGIGWSSLGGVRDVAGKTYIIPELTPGSHDKTLYFYAENAGGTSFEAGTWTSSLLQINSPGFRVPTGNTSARPSGLYGEIRFNTETLQFEGFDGTNWASMGGVRSPNGTTHIDATNTELDFYVNSVLKGTVTSDGFNLGNIRITANTISAKNTNGNVNLTADGTGVVAVTGTGALRIPAGTTAQQPGASVGSVTGDAGWIRYNTDLKALELWSQASSSYVPVTGSSSAAGDTKITFETAGNDEKIIRFYVGNALPFDPVRGSTEIAYISKDGFFVDGTTIKTQIVNGTIQTATTNTDLTLKGNGTGSVTVSGPLHVTGSQLIDRDLVVTGHPTFEGVLSTGATGIGNLVFNSSPTFVGHITVEGVTATGATGTGKFVFDTTPSISNPTITGHATVEGVTATGATGTGKFVFGTNPTIVTPAITGPTVITDTATGPSYTLKVINGNITGSVFGIGTGNGTYGIANDALNNSQNGYVPYTVSASTITLKTGASVPATALAIDSGGLVTIGALTVTTSASLSPTGTVTINPGTISSVDNVNIGANTAGTGAFTTLTSNTLTVNGRISIHDNVIENTYTNDDLIIRANGTGRVIIDGSGTGAGAGNVFATDPLLTFNSGLSGNANTYDAGFIINRGTSPNAGFVWSEAAGEFRAISTLEPGTVKGPVSVSSYKNISTNTVKLNSETATKLAFVDSSKYVRSLDTGRTAVVDGTLTFNSTAQLKLPAGSNSQRPGSATTGSVRYNTDSQIFEGYGTAGWQAMGVGVGTGVDYQSFVGNGTLYQFTLQQTPLGAGSIMVVVNGIVQQPGVSYQVLNNILSFADTNGNTFAPESGDTIDVRFLSKPSVSSVREYNYIGDGSNTTFPVEFTINSVAEVMVFVNNIYQDSAVYTYSGINVVFTQAPFANERVCIVHLCAIIAPNVPTVQSAQDDAIAFSIALG
jgi:hypothetical protein